MARSQARSSAAPTRPAAILPGAKPHDLAGSDALERLNRALRELKLQALVPFLNEAVVHIRADRYREGGELALKALEIDDQCAAAWHLMAVCREKAGDFTSSLKCYDKAFALDPDDADIAYNLGHLAFRMDMKTVAEQLFRHYLVHEPQSPDGANNLACALRDQSRFDEAIEVARTAIYANPACALLWNTLGTILTEQGDIDNAVTFYDEALRLDPEFAKARYNRANAHKSRGELAAAIADCERAIGAVVLESEIATMRFARSTMLTASGRLGEGWDAYECRFDPHHPEVLHFMTDLPRWTPDTELAGRSLLVFAEQGLGDEVLFANVIPDVLDALGPKGRLTLAVEPRLVELFQRSFPTARVGAHATGKVDHHSVRVARFAEGLPDLELWAPLGSLLRRYRRSVEAFPRSVGYLEADPERVAFWRRSLAGHGDQPKVGLVWKSLKADSARFRFYSPFEFWKPLLTTPGVTFVNLQYGDCAAELQTAKDRFGVEVWQPPGIDLKADLDDVAALSCALDLSIGPANATTNIAGACGAPVWLISTPGSWPECGTDHYPWYPQLRLFRAPAFNQWGPVMEQAAAAVTEAFARP